MYSFAKRSFDILFSFTILLVLIPFLLGISFGILIASGMPIIYKQDRIGKNWKVFKIFKFRTMVNNADKIGPGISTQNDSRVSGIGVFLRKFKLDELPQFINVLKGDMSIIGPRPELLQYALKYTSDYTNILKVRPGISDYASIRFRNEASLLEGKTDPEEFYLNSVLPQKIKMYREYVSDLSLVTDVKIFFVTIKSIFSNE